MLITYVLIKQKCVLLSPRPIERPILSPFSFLFSFFLVVSARLYKRVCPSVGPSIRSSVCPSVRPSGTLSLSGQKQRRRTTYAVHPALFRLLSLPRPPKRCRLFLVFLSFYHHLRETIKQPIPSPFSFFFTSLLLLLSLPQRPKWTNGLADRLFATPFQF